MGEDGRDLAAAPGTTASPGGGALAALVAELRRRRVFRVLVGYGIASFAVLQIAEPVMHGLRLPDWVLTATVVVLALGFPVAVGLAWAFDLTPSGIVRTPPAQAAPAPAPGSIAVLPFADLSPAQDQGHFCEGIADELLTALSSVSGLRVASRGSSFQFRGGHVDGRTVGRSLGVATALEGGVRRSGNRVRVSAQLSGTADGFQLWSGTYDRSVDDIFAIQEEIAQAVVGALLPHLAGGARLTRTATRSTPAYDMYLRGRQFLMSHSESGYRHARQMFRGAIELDPGFALAHAGLADTLHFSLAWHLDDARADALRAEGIAASAEALRLAPDLAEVRVSRANWLSFEGRTEEADAEFRKACALNPALPHAHYFLARHLVATGRVEEAAREFEETIRLDPEDFASAGILVSIRRGRGDRDGAATAARHVLAAVERRLRLHPDDVRALYMGGGAALTLGQREAGLRYMDRAVEMAPDDFATQYNLACAFASGGEVERALDAFDRAVGPGRGNRRWFENDADLDAVRHHPRFAEILSRLPA